MHAWQASGKTAAIVGLWLAVLPAFVSASETPGLTVVLGYEGMARFAARAEYANPREHPALFRRFVYERYRRQCANGGATSERMLSTPFRDLAALDAAVAEIRAADVRSLVADAAADAHALMPLDALTVCVFVYPADSRHADVVRRQMGGVMGFSEARGTLWLQILPVPGWQEAIYPAFAHEYYHAVNHPDEHRQSSTLLDYLVNEGGADSFTAILYPDFVPAWTRAISPEQQRALWPLLEPELSSRNPATIDRFMFGDGESVPFQAGYTVGFEIVQGYLEAHPAVEPADWSRLDAREIFEGSGYDPSSD